ncbi:MAG: hypothetical protein AAFZ07_05915 [Actinomycetota bacterium]
MATVTRNQPSKLAISVLNPVMRWLLRRGKGPTSHMMLISWNGRKSGRAYSTPVSRFELDERLVTTTASPWKANFVGGHPVDVIVDGRLRSMRGTVIDDPAHVGETQRRIIDDLGDAAQRAMAIRYDTPPSADELAALASSEGIVLIEFTSGD